MKIRHLRVILVIIAFLITICATPNLARASQTVGRAAQFQSTSTPTYTHTKIEKRRVPDKLCAKLKATDLRDVNNPALCTYTHVEKWTDLIPTKNTTSLAQSGCPSGTQTFNDYTISDLGLWEINMNSSFGWAGTCSAPYLYGNQGCWVAWTVNTSITNQWCYNYYTDVPSHAHVYSVTITENLGATLTFPDSIRRECYADFSCSWNEWQGY